MKKIIITFLLFAICFINLPAVARAETEEIIVVLDPGHGGENLGSEYLVQKEKEQLEKELNLMLAQMIREQLEQYPNIEVYLTRETDEAMTLKQRAAAAAEKQADILVSLHFNDSKKHEFFGSELWISGKKEFYEESFRLAWCLENQLEELGIHSRGIKTKLSEDGKSDYYGIIREGVKKEIFTILVEHCFVDSEKDRKYWENGLLLLAKADAEAIINYIEGEGKDRDDFPSYFTDPADLGNWLEEDNSPPEYVKVKQEDGNGEFVLFSEDGESKLSYYSYSFNGGKIWSDLRAWEGGKQCRIDIPIPKWAGRVVFRAYNGYGLYTESEWVRIRK